MRKIAQFVASCCVVASLSACPNEPIECLDGTEETCDGGSLPPDFCNSQEEADSDPNCQLTVTSGGAMPAPKTGVFISRLSDGGVEDKDWYLAQMPALTPRSLLHVSGGYGGVPGTGVNFSVNVLKQGPNGMVTVTNGIDRHGASAPKQVDLILPFGESNAKLYVLVGDERTNVDNRNPYSLFVEVKENPDMNEPNDTTPTAIALTPMGAITQGTATGYLATNDDVDLFSFPVTATGRQIIYLHITEVGTHPTNPPPGYRLAYTLLDPSDVPISEGQMDNDTLAVNLATARLAPMTGTYKVKLNGFKAPNTTGPVKGDLRLQYQVQVQLMPDVDTHEPNDTLATAKPLSLSANGSTSVTGKLSTVPDEEWFVVSLPARASPSTFRYRVTAATGGGRFEPLTGTPNRQIRVTRRVTLGNTAQERQNNCKTNATACHKASDAEPSLINSICASSEPPQCLYAQRSEELPRIAMLRNFVGAIPIEPNVATEFLVMFRDEGLGAAKYADDRDWTMQLEWRDDTDEAARLGGPTNAALSGSNTVSQGELTYGYGLYLDSEWFNSSNGLRGLNDYDAYDSDKDLFQFGFGGATAEQSWELAWELQHVDGGTEAPGELAFELTFCDAAAPSDGGLCPGAQNRIVAFNPASLTPWYLSQSISNGRALFTRTNNGTSTTYSLAPVGCSCFSTSRLAAGTFFANVAAVHRLSNDPIRYQFSQRITPYPGSYTADGGATVSCPVTDGGCGFAR